MKTVLVTGFEPFGGDLVNPSQEIARALEGRVIAGRRVVGAVLPCVFGLANVELRKLLRTTRPELVICLGLAGGRTEITPERVAINVDDARIADNAGAQPIDEPVVRGGPTAYWSTLPIKAIVAALRQRGIPASVSQTTGTFVCNHVFYGLMQALARGRGRRGGFIHVPPVQAPGTKGQPGLPLATMINAIALAVELSVQRRTDVRATGGQTH
ncbi:MAG: pyroglutamyl-peptidase I [Opitutus sp.]|nr:pyroglutamyl-peptidase I [Opitutus sp.]